MQVCFWIIFPLTNLSYYKIGYDIEASYFLKHFQLKVNFNSLQSKGSNNYSLNLFGIGIGKNFSFLELSIYEFLIFRKYESFYEYGFNPSFNFSIKIGSKFILKSENYFIFGNKKTLPLMSLKIGLKLWDGIRSFY